MKRAQTNAYQWREQDSRKVADLILVNRRDSYAARVQELNTGGPKAKVIAAMLRMAKGRGVLDQVIATAKSVKGPKGMHIDALCRELKNSALSWRVQS